MTESEFEYIDKWIDTSVELSEWEQNRIIDHWEIIDQLDLTDKQIEEIEAHQFSLFNSKVNRHVEYIINRQTEKSEKVRKEIINEHLRLIDLFTKSIEVNKVLVTLLEPIISFNENNYAGILKGWQKLITDEYSDFRTDFNIGQKGNYFQGNYYLASVMFNYRKQIVKISEANTPILTTAQVTRSFQNNFDNIPPTEVYSHFKAGLVDKRYLTVDELNDYLKAAFELQKVPVSPFKIKDAPTKKAIEAVFYTYYKNVAGKIHGKQNQYAALLGNYFEGYNTTTVSSNFSKSVY